MTKSYIWSLPTRVFHWLLVLYIVMLFITSEVERFLDIHAGFGYGVGVLLLFRFGWFFIGPRYTRWSDFNKDIKEALNFGLNILKSKKIYAGHNPAASFVILGILFVLFLATFFGVLTYGVQEGRGILSFLNSSFFREMELFEELHELFSNLLLVLVAFHLGGVFVEYVLHKEQKVLNSIFNGYKMVKAKDVKLNTFQKLFATIMLTVALITPIMALGFESILTRSSYQKIDYEKESAIFVEECASCHLLYPPFLLPKKSWKDMMVNLEDHFGDDASLDSDTKKKIESFLVTHSSENSTKESAYHISKSIKNNDIIAITESPFWKKRHKDINKELFLSKKVRSKANCKACHTWFENGLLEDSLIKSLEM